MTTSTTLVGSQRPSIEHRPEAVGTFGPQVCKFLSRVGVNLDDWQRYVMDGLFAYTEDRRWAANEFGLLVSRQNGKGEILVGYDLAHLYLFPRPDNRRKTILHSAHEVKTADDGFGRLTGVIEANEYLLAKLAPRGIKIGNGAKSVTMAKRPGQQMADRAAFIARTKSSGRGFAADVLVYDEAQEFASKARDALTYTSTTAPNRQELFTGTVPGPEDNPEVFEGVRDRGRSGVGKKTGWMEWSPEGSWDPKAQIIHPKTVIDIDPTRPVINLTDPETWIASIPSLGIRTFEDTVKDQVDRATDIAALSRERFSIWPNPAEAVEPVYNDLDLEKWGLNALEDARVAIPEAIAIAVGKGYCSVAASARFDDERIAVEHKKTDRGTLWVAQYVADLKEEFPDALVVLDPKNASMILTDLTRVGVKYLSMNLNEVAGAYSTFIERANDGLIVHPPQPEVATSLKFAVPRSIGQAGMTWNASDPTKPVSLAQAVTWASFGLIKLESAPPREPAMVRGYA